MLLFDNPEFLRLARSKLRPRSMLLLGAAGVLVLGTILMIMYWNLQSGFGRSTPSAMLRDFFYTVAGLQLGVISLYGLFLASQNITQERERHTFEFQRLVAMGPRKLAIGKLFGAPCEAWWLVLIGTLFAFFPVLAGAVDVVECLRAQLVVYVYGILISSLGLMCSSAFEKTSRVTGLAVLMVIFF